MPLTIMENVEPELEIGRDLPGLITNQSCVYSRKEKHHAPQEVPVVTLQEHCQETEPETIPNVKESQVFQTVNKKIYCNNKMAWTCQLQLGKASDHARSI